MFIYLFTLSHFSKLGPISKQPFLLHFIYLFAESDRKLTMAGRLSHVASQIMAGNGVVSRSGASSLRLRSGMGLPVGKHIVPDKPLPINDELVWDNGTPFPEPCIDRIADTVGKYEALGWLCGGLGFFATLGLMATLNDKASKIPYTPKVFPYDNLRVELGGEP
uniref:NADH dehydrogenase [ubiquinone] 1 beta subcomplex subunit 8, mitochondrial n=3 Tax=Helianthus annuus TaxID=4232 RepID=A0A251SRH5_HELAN